MLTKYIDAAMRKAHYELIEDGTYWGEIPGFQGVWGNAPTLEECREDLLDALGGWIALGLWSQDETLPEVDGIGLVPERIEDEESVGEDAEVKHESPAPSRSRKAS